MARGNQPKANTGVYTFIDLPINITANEKSSTKKPFKKVYEREEEEEYVEPLTSTEKVTLTLINVFWFIIFFVTLFSPFPHLEWNLFQTYGERYLILRYMVLVLSVAMMAFMSLKLEGGEIKKIKGLSCIISSEKYAESSVLFYLTLPWMILSMSIFFTYSQAESTELSWWSLIIFFKCLVVPLAIFAGFVVNNSRSDEFVF